MGAIKRTPADKYFSDCIREAADWTCHRCGSHFPDPSRRMGLHCSHFHGRGKWGTRFVVNNCEALCYGCHQYLGANPTLHAEHVEKHIGEGAMDILREKANDTSIGRANRKDAKEIAAFYRAEFKRLRDCRINGAVGQLKVMSWN